MKKSRLSILTNQPRGLYVLCLTAMWEYFSYYGMRALLVLYMSKALLFSDEKSYTIYGGYGALVYITPLLGNWLASQFMNHRLTIMLGCLGLIVGHVFLAFGGLPLFYFSLALIICGNGLSKPNIVHMLGMLYDKQHEGRNAGFTLFYVGANVGSFLAPLVCGVIASVYGWTWGFMCAGLGMIFGLVVFYLGKHHLPLTVKPMKRTVEQTRAFQTGLWVFPILIVSIVLVMALLKAALAGGFLNIVSVIAIGYLVWVCIQSKKEARKGIIAMGILLFFGTVFWAFDQQAGSSITLFTDRIVDRNLWGWTIPVPFFQSVNPIVIMIVGPLLSLLWLRLDKQHKGLTPGVKFCIALFLACVSFLILVLAAWWYQRFGSASFLWVVLAYFIITVGELCCEPVGLAAANSLPPKHMAGVMISYWYLFTGAYANYLASLIAKLTSYNAKQNTLQFAAKIYQHVFFEVGMVAIIACVLMIMSVYTMRHFSKKHKVL